MESQGNVNTLGQFSNMQNLGYIKRQLVIMYTATDMLGGNHDATILE